MTKDPRKRQDDEDREDEMLEAEAERRLSDPKESEEDAEKVLQELGL